MIEMYIENEFMEQMSRWYIPPWLQYICYVIIAIILVCFAVLLYRNYLVTFISKRKQVSAILVSKITEQKTGVAAYNRSLQPKAKPEYKLYFYIADKYVDFEVDKDTWDLYEEDMIGILDYKGKCFYDFIVVPKSADKKL